MGGQEIMFRKSMTQLVGGENKEVERAGNRLDRRMLGGKAEEWKLVESWITDVVIGGDAGDRPSALPVAFHTLLSHISTLFDKFILQSPP